MHVTYELAWALGLASSYILVKLAVLGCSVPFLMHDACWKVALPEQRLGS